MPQGPPQTTLRRGVRVQRAARAPTDPTEQGSAGARRAGPWCAVHCQADTHNPHTHSIAPLAHCSPVQMLLPHSGPQHQRSQNRFQNNGRPGGAEPYPDGGRHPRARGAIEGKGPQRRPQKQYDRRLEEVAKAVGGGGGYCRLQMPLTLALAVRETVARRRLGALEVRGGVLPPLPIHPCPGHHTLHKTAVASVRGVLACLGRPRDEVVHQVTRSSASRRCRPPHP